MQPTTWWVTFIMPLPPILCAVRQVISGEEAARLGVVAEAVDQVSPQPIDSSEAWIG
jgi:hypothetical protein